MKEKLEKFVEKYHDGTNDRSFSNAKHKNFVNQEVAVYVSYNTKNLNEFLETFKLYELMRDNYENK